jgi:hypothetical protein
MSEERPFLAQGRKPGEMHSIGTWQGLPPGRVMHHLGMLDLRHIPPEQLAQVEEIHTVDVLLLEEQTREHLRPATMHHVGSVLVAAPDERVLVTPQLELTRAAIEGMGGGQKLLVMGNVFFRPDVPPSLVAEKFESLRVFGVLIACAGVHGVLLGKAQVLNGVTVALPDEIGPVVCALGEIRMTREYLAGLPEGTTYLNVGKTELEDGLAAEALREKVIAYYNVGETKGPAMLLAALQARCPLNLGRFHRE